MKSLKLSFGVIHMISNTIAEVIVDEGTEITEAMVNEYHESLIANFKAPFFAKSKGQNSFIYQSIKIWNFIPDFIRTAHSVNIFQTLLENI